MMQGKQFYSAFMHICVCVCVCACARAHACLYSLYCITCLPGGQKDTFSLENMAKMRSNLFVEHAYVRLYTGRFILLYFIY
jgi:hypothetical protein